MIKKIAFLFLFSGIFELVQAQKGEKTITAGPLISFPLGLESASSNFKIGLGVELVGQWNISNRSGLLLKTTLASWGYKERMTTYGDNRFSLLTFQGGYRYLFGTAGFFADGLVGIDLDLHDNYTTVCFTLGLGKRFINKGRYIDVGVDLVGGDAEERLNIKVLFSLFQ